MPKGTAITRAPSVTAIEPTIIARMPNSPLLGRQVSPNRNSVIDTSWKMGMPSIKIKAIIAIRMMKEREALIRTVYLAALSDKYRENILSPQGVPIGLIVNHPYR